MNVAPESVEFEEGEFYSAGSNRRMAFAEIALAAYVAQSFPTDELEPGLKADAFFDPSVDKAYRMADFYKIPDGVENI